MELITDKLKLLCGPLNESPSKSQYDLRLFPKSSLFNSYSKSVTYQSSYNNNIILTPDRALSDSKIMAFRSWLRS